MTFQFDHPPLNRSGRDRSAGFEPVPYDGFANYGFYRRMGKRILDCALILISLPIVLPVIGIFALLISLDGGAPIYRQKRLGRDGQVFHIFKLRTMVRDAEHVLEQYLDAHPRAREEWDHKQKLRKDPRITRVGNLLRKTSLDELPQLWNVLTGEMALVGPRPMMVSQKDMYPGELYYHMRPGITGLWQVSDRNETSFAERAAYDAEYYRRLSLSLDMSLLVRTIGVVLRGTGY